MPAPIENRLTRDERMYLYRLAGEGYTPREISNTFNLAKFGKARIRVPGVQKILELPEAYRYVAKFRTEFLKNIREIPIAEKKVRLDDMEKLRQRLMHIIINCHLEKGQRGAKEVARFIQATKCLKDILELARGEMENRPELAKDLNKKEEELSDFTDEQLKEQREELIRKAQRIVDGGAIKVDEIAERDEETDGEGSDPILLASPEELRRDEVSGGGVDIFDIRQQEDNDSRLPSI